MKKQTKIGLVCILGLILIVILGFASSQSKRSKEDTSSTDERVVITSDMAEEYGTEEQDMSE